MSAGFFKQCGQLRDDGLMTLVLKRSNSVREMVVICCKIGRNCVRIIGT